MIIDVHCHVWDKTWLPSWAWKMFNSALAPRYGLTLAQMEKLREKSCDPSGDIMVASMDRAGVDKAIVCNLDYGLVESLEDAPTPIEEINRLTYEMVKRHPHRLYFAVGVDPRRPNALELVETAVRYWGAKSLKLYPATGWFPNDKIVYPLYEKSVELGIPVNFHTGPIFAPLKSKYTQPIHLDDVAADFPELTIHCTHTAYFSYMEMAGLARSKQNLVLDLGGWLSWLRGSQSTAAEFYRIFRFLMDTAGSRLMFASDWTGLTEDSDYCDWVNAFKHIPDWVSESGIKFSERELSAYFSGNAVRLLHLDETI